MFNYNQLDDDAKKIADKNIKKILELGIIQFKENGKVIKKFNEISDDKKTNIIFPNLEHWTEDTVRNNALSKLNSNIEIQDENFPKLMSKALSDLNRLFKF